tara:strand:+ start:1894 stop:3102 length:1209 start_codon:yes stop_codon:yes gene_type:complete
MHENGFEDLESELKNLQLGDMYRSRRVVESSQGPRITLNNRELLNFCSNDYLGLASDKRISEAFVKGVHRWGSGAGASHLVCGHTSAHEELEEALADHTGRPRALLYSSGYAANVGVINALLTKGDYVYEDRLNHASLLDGGWISRSQFEWYPHGDVNQLKQALSTIQHNTSRKLIVTDGTFSMDGDLAPIEDLINTAKTTGAWLMVDDAHGIGVHGSNGCGLVDPSIYTTDEVQILVGTLGKALGTSGAFVAGAEPLIETLIQKSRNYIFTTAMPSALAEATLTSLQIAQKENWRRMKLETLIKTFRQGATELGLKLLPSSSPIQPIVVGSPEVALAMSASLESSGCLCTAIRPPTVPEGTSRLRITLMATHTESDVARLLDALELAQSDKMLLSIDGTDH